MALISWKSWRFLIDEQLKQHKLCRSCRVVAKSKWCNMSSSEQLLTFQHFHGDGERLVGLLLVDADGLGHDHLPEAALPQWLPQSQPETKPQQVYGLASEQRWMQGYGVALSLLLTGIEGTPTWGQRAAPAQRRWPGSGRRSRTAGRSGPAGCWSSWTS